MTRRFGSLISLLPLILAGACMQAHAEGWQAVPYEALMGGIENTGTPDATTYSAALPHVAAELDAPGTGHIKLTYKRTFKYISTGQPPVSFPSFWVSLTGHINGHVNGSASDTSASSSAAVWFKAPLNNSAPLNYDEHKPDIPASSDPLGLLPFDHWIEHISSTSDTVNHFITVEANASVSFEYPSGNASSSAAGTDDICIFFLPIVIGPAS